METSSDDGLQGKINARKQPVLLMIIPTVRKTFANPPTACPYYALPSSDKVLAYGW